MMAAPSHRMTAMALVEAGAGHDSASLPEPD